MEEMLLIIKLREFLICRAISKFRLGNGKRGWSPLLLSILEYIDRRFGGNSGYDCLGSKSCEMIAAAIAQSKGSS